MCSETSLFSLILGSISMLTPTSRYVNCVLTRGLTPTPATPGWKLPLAVGTFSPILSVALALSTARICGACRTVVLESFSTASSAAPGRLVIEKSALDMWLSALSGTFVLVGEPAAVVLPVVVVVGVVVVAVVVPVVVVVDPVVDVAL